MSSRASIPGKAMTNDAPAAKSATVSDMSDDRIMIPRSERITMATNDEADSTEARISFEARVERLLICPTAHKVRKSRTNVPPARRSKESRYMRIILYAPSLYDCMQLIPGFFSQCECRSQGRLCVLKCNTALRRTVSGCADRTNE